MGRRSKGKNGKKVREKKAKEKPVKVCPEAPLGSASTLRELCLQKAKARPIINIRRIGRVAFPRQNLPALEERQKRQAEEAFRALSSSLYYQGKKYFPGGGDFYHWRVSYPQPVKPLSGEPTRMLWHGSPLTNFADILTKSLQPGRTHCLFGSAIYLGNVEKALHFCGLQGLLLKCRVSPGRVYKAPGKVHGPPEGFDSVMGVKGFTKAWGGHLQNNEWAFYDPAQVSVHEVYIRRRDLELR